MFSMGRVGAVFRGAVDSYSLLTLRTPEWSVEAQCFADPH